MASITHPYIHPKGWGRELWIANNELYCSKILEVNKGKKCSIHYHKIKDETFCILDGVVEMRIWEDGYPGEQTTIIMRKDDTLHIPVGLPHQFFGIENSKILEVSTQHFEEDSYRYVRGD